MEKLIVRNETDLSMIEILDIVKGHVSQGRISKGEAYCSVCTWDCGLISVATKNKDSDTITVRNLDI